MIDPHKLWVGLSIAAAQAHCPYISDVKDLRCWTAVTGIPIKDMGSVARAYMVVTGQDAVFDVREVEQMTEKLLGMLGESDADPRKVKRVKRRGRNCGLLLGESH